MRNRRGEVLCVRDRAEGITPFRRSARWFVWNVDTQTVVSGDCAADSVGGWIQLIRAGSWLYPAAADAPHRPRWGQGAWGLLLWGTILTCYLIIKFSPSF